MQIKFKKMNRQLVVKLEGELDHHTSIEIREKIDREINKSPIKDLIFDFEKLSFMDSSGIGVIIGRYKLIQKRNGKTGLVNANPQVMRIIHISGLHKIIPVFGSVNDALAQM